MVLREFGSPVPAQTMFVSDGAMASIPIATTGLSSNTGRQVVPLLVLFQMPPPAAATKSVLEGLGIPTTSDSRPMKLAGPTVRQRKPAAVAESSVWAASGAARPASSDAPPRRRANRIRIMDDPGLMDTSATGESRANVGGPARNGKGESTATSSHGLSASLSRRPPAPGSAGPAGASDG